jgi:tRNA nucleotidyltransferase (CCA-adding enzyme)
VILNDSQLGVFVAKVLHLGPGKRKEFVKQVDNLITELEKKLKEDASFKVKGFKKTGSIIKGTVLKPRGENGVDADIAVFLDVSESDKGDVAKLHTIIKELLAAVYPMKEDEDFQVQPRTLGIHFRQSGLDVDLVPVIPIASEPGYGWQPSSENSAPIKTSIEKQLAFIKKRRDADPRFRTLVRLAKQWRNTHDLDEFRSFTIELIICHLQDTQGVATSLEDGLRRFYLYVAQSGLQKPISFAENGTVIAYPKSAVVILDPVNNSNNVAARLTGTERDGIVAAAKTAWETLEAASWKDGKGETLDLWREIMGRSFTIDAD